MSTGMSMSVEHSPDPWPSQGLLFRDKSDALAHFCMTDRSRRGEERQRYPQEVQQAARTQSQKDVVTRPALPA